MGFYGGGGGGFYGGGGDYGGGYDTGSYGYGYDGSADAVSASRNSSGGSTTTYTNADGTTYTVTGTIPNRDHNPLDVRGGTYQIGTDNTVNGKFAIFSTDQDGFNSAQQTLSNTYGDSSINSIISKWSPPGGNNTSQIQSQVDSALGLSGSETWNSLSSSQQNAYLNYYASHVEGYHGPSKGS